VATAKEIAHCLGWDQPKDLALARKINKEKNIVLFNFTRSVPKTLDVLGFYHFLETIKDVQLNMKAMIF
jgi:hypothetical protein